MTQNQQISSMNEKQTEPATPPRTRYRLQFSLTTILLLVAAVSVWLVNHDLKQQISTIRAQLPGLESVARQLIVDDPTQVAVVCRMPERLGECIYDVHIPQYKSFELFLALEQVDKQGIAEPVNSVPVSAGKHSIEIRYDAKPDQSIVFLLIDGEIVIEERKAKDWEPRHGSTGAGSVSNSEQFDDRSPIVLFRQRFMVSQAPNSSTTPPGPCRGILVWLENAK